MKKGNVVLSLLIALSSVAVSAGHGLKLGQLDYGGTGCPSGTASAVVSPDESAISILFDNFVVEAGAGTGKRIARKSCNMTIPVYVPQGYSVAVIAVDYRGYNLVPPGGVNRFNAEYFWAGHNTVPATKNYFGPLNSDYLFTNNLLAQTLIWAPCGASVNLRVNTSLRTESNQRMDQTMMTMDSADISASLVYHLQWKKCF